MCDQPRCERSVCVVFVYISETTETSDISGCSRCLQGRLMTVYNWGLVQVDLDWNEAECSVHKASVFEFNCQSVISYVVMNSMLCYVMNKIISISVYNSLSLLCFSTKFRANFNIFPIRSNFGRQGSNTTRILEVVCRAPQPYYRKSLPT